MNTSNKTWLIVLPVLIGISLSLLAIFYFGAERIEFGDAKDYINSANAILHGMPYPRRGDFHPVFRAPVFPAFIALGWTFFPDSTIAFKVGQALLHGLTCFVIYKITFELVRRHFPAFLAAGICAINPLMFGFTVDFFSEPMQVFLVAISTFVLIKVLKGDDKLYYRAVLLGVCFGLSTLCRPTILPIVLCLIPLIFVLFIRDQKLRLKYFFASGLVALGLFATVAPWTYANYRATGEFIPVVNGFAYNLWLGNHPDTLRLYEGTYTDKADNQAFADHWASDLPGDKMRELEQSDNLSSLSLNAQEKVWRREAFEEMRENPDITARLVWGKIKAYWTPFLNSFSYPFPMVVLVAALVIGLYIFSPLGACILWQDETGRKVTIMLAIQFVLVTLLHSIIIANVRYRIPYVDPYLAILTAIAIWRIAARLLPKYDFLQT